MKKRRNNYMKKRVTLCGLLLRALALVLALTAAFAVGFQIFLTNYIDGQCRERIDEYLGNISNYAAVTQKNDDPSIWMARIKADLLMTGSAFGAFPLPGSEKYGIDPGWTPNCYACAVLTDEQGNIAASNRRALGGSFVFSPAHFGGDSAESEHDSGFLYLCDPLQLNIPELTQLFDRYDELLEDPELRYVDNGNPNLYVSMEFTSAYVNRETRTCVPHEGALIKTRYEDLDDPGKELVRIPVSIDLDLPGYELIKIREQREGEFDPEKLEYPFGNFLWLYGVKREVIDEFGKWRDFNSHVNTYTYRLGDGNAISMGSIAVVIDRQHYLLSARTMVDYSAPSVVKYFCTRVLFFAAGLSLLALLWCLWRNMKNKTKYAMEDYQRALTDNLAHDVKTPLMAISGYAENVRDGELPAEKQKKYVNAIIENVAYTDNLVSRTLQLNHMGEAKPVKPEKLALEKLAAELLQKYRPLLAEKRIAHSVEGSATVEADPAAADTILENLISNAVRYTPELGKIRIELSPKLLTVANTVEQKIDVKKLKEPFVRGDAARSNVKGNGLGLSLADQAARLSGFKLNLSCTDKEFKAELKL